MLKRTKRLLAKIFVEAIEKAVQERLAVTTIHLPCPAPASAAPLQEEPATVSKNTITNTGFICGRFWHEIVAANLGRSHLQVHKLQPGCYAISISVPPESGNLMDEFVNYQRQFVFQAVGDVDLGARQAVAEIERTLSGGKLH